MAPSDQYTLLSLLSDGVLITDQAYTIIFANQPFCDLCATGREKIIGHKCHEVLHYSPFPCAGNDIQEQECVHSQVFVTGLPAVVSHFHTNAEGVKKFLQITASPMKDANGAVSGLMCIIKDRTREKELQDALTTTLLEQETLLDSAPYYLSYVDREMRVVKLNSSMEQLIGHKTEEIRGRYCYEVWGQHAGDAGKQGREKICDPCRVHCTVADGRKYRYERQIGDRYIEVTSSPVRNKQGEIIGALECGVDITDRLRAEKEATKSKEEWEKTFDAISDIITIQDKEMRIVRANKATHLFFKAGDGELTGRYCYELFRDTSTPCPDCPLLQTIEKGTNHCGIIDHERLGRIFQISSSPVLDEEGKFRYLVHIARDITEQKKLEENLFQAQKMEAIGNLAGGIAHDFNNILSAILGYSQLAKLDLAAGTAAHRAIDQVITAGNRAGALVQQILDFSRKTEQIQQPLKPHLIVSEVLQLLRSTLPNSVGILTDIDSDCGTILADATKIHQVVMNLCTNAFHALGNATGIIRISLSLQNKTTEELQGHNVPPGPYVMLSVSDTGRGMPPETVARIFEPYFTTKDRGKGTGLGLAVTHGIITGFKGFIEVESTPDAGSTFRIYIPALKEGAVIAEEPIKQKRNLSGQERIIVVDDDPLLMRIHQSILEDLGYRVTGMTNSEEALKKVEANPQQFDLVLTDQTMPQLTGAELAAAILKIAPAMPIILCTGHSDLTSHEAVALGVKRYLQKPVQGDELARTVRMVLNEQNTPL